MNYSDLQTDIITWAMRSGDDEFVPAVPGFIRLAESRISRLLRLSRMEKTSIGTLTDGEVTLPADYLQYRTVLLGRHALQFITPDNVYAVMNEPGTPRFFTISGRVIEIYPKGPGDLTLIYYAKIPALSDAEPTNWLLELAPELYLYGALIEAASFMMDDQRIQTWGTKFDLALRALQSEDEMSKYANVSTRTRGATP